MIICFGLTICYLDEFLSTCRRFGSPSGTNAFRRHILDGSRWSPDGPVGMVGNEPDGTERHYSLRLGTYPFYQFYHVQSVQSVQSVLPKYVSHFHETPVNPPVFPSLYTWCIAPSQARDLEMRAVVRVRVLSAFNSLVGSVLSVMVPVTVFAWYTLVNRKALDAATGHGKWVEMVKGYERMLTYLTSLGRWECLFRKKWERGSNGQGISSFLSLI